MKKIVTIILDGFGYREETKGNAIKEANMETFNKLWETYPHSLLEASEESVGLSKGQFGNSEVGHMTIGAGRLLKQNETLVNELLLKINENEVYQSMIENNKDKTFHIMGLCSDGNVHAGIDDFINMYESLVASGVTKIYFHLITDGRDTDTVVAFKYIKQIAELIKVNKVGSIATICGRFYAMDRDKHYDRTKLYYDLITNSKGAHPKDFIEHLKTRYAKGETDEFLKPIVIDGSGKIKNDDVVIWMNYRADRSKQIIDALTNKEFTEFATEENNITVYSFFPIDKNIKTTSFMETPLVTNPLGLYLSELGLTQARIAETEKYAHVTYFFDGGFSGKINKCNTFNIPSPSVPTYDEKPEMSSILVTKKAIECMMQDYDFILVNYANGDMVGHTGNYLAATKACMALDMCLNKIIEKAEENFYKVIILADHGNCDIMIDDNDKPVTTHTLSKVPFIMLDNQVELKSGGDLTMVAPTILEYMDIALPEEMKETDNLFVK